MVPDPYVTIYKLVDKLPPEEIDNFYEEVGKCRGDSSWLRENNLSFNSKKEDVMIVLYNQLY